MGIDHDLQAGYLSGPGGGRGHVRAGLLARSRGLPEAGFAAARAGEDDLGAVLPRTVQDDVDGGAPPHAGAQVGAFHDVGLVRPFVAGDGIAVQSVGPRPGPPRCGTPSRPLAAAAAGRAAWSPDRGCGRSTAARPQLSIRSGTAVNWRGHRDGPGVRRRASDGRVGLSSRRRRVGRDLVAAARAPGQRRAKRGAWCEPEDRLHLPVSVSAGNLWRGCEKWPRKPEF